MEVQKLNSYFRYAFENGSINNDERTAMEIQVEPRKFLAVVVVTKSTSL